MAAYKPMNKVPTLLVGLGGIGCRTVQYISDLLTDEEKKYVAAVGMDTNIEDLKTLSIQTIQTSDARLVKEFLEINPQYRKWFPVNKFTVNRGMLTGAGQIRGISRLAAVAAYKQGKFKALSNEIRRVRKQETNIDNSAFNVFIFGSITGGTGAGLFLQVPYMIRKLAEGASNIRIRGMFISADVTSPVQNSTINEKATMVNAYACMKELNAFYLTQNMRDEDNRLELEFYAKPNIKENMKAVRKQIISSDLEEEISEDFYDDSIGDDVGAIASDGANIPYDAFYLIENSSNMGTVGNAKLDDIQRQIAKMVYTLLFSPVKTVDSGVGDNFILQQMESGGMNRYNSAGMCCLKYPYEKMLEYVTLRWVEELIQEEWLLLDDRIEEEKQEALNRQKSDPAVKIPKVEQAYVRLFEKECEGGSGKKLAYLKEQAFMPSDGSGARANKAAQILRSIDDEINKLASAPEILAAKAGAEINYKKAMDMEGAISEIVRVYSSINAMEDAVEEVLANCRFQIANAVLPASMTSMRMNKDEDLCVYNLLTEVHPIVTRYLCYDMINTLRSEIPSLEAIVSAYDLRAYKEEDFDEKKPGKQDAVTAVRLVQQKVVPVIRSGKKSLQLIINQLVDSASNQTSLLEEYCKNTLKLDTYRILLERFEALAACYEVFFEGLRAQMRVNAESVNMIENGFINNPFGETLVCCRPEAFKALYNEFKKKVQFQLPSETQVRIFDAIYNTTCSNLNANRTELSDEQRRKFEENQLIAMKQVFNDCVVGSMRNVALKDGDCVINLSVKDAIAKEMEINEQIGTSNPDLYEAKRVEYEKKLISDAMLKATPMFTVSPREDFTQIVYVAMNPHSAELLAGDPSESETERRVVETRSAATDNQPVKVLLDPAFSKYEIICMKTRHNYEVEDLVKYQPNSDFHLAYEERIRNLGKDPLKTDENAFKTVVNPHLNRYWHELGMIPKLTSKEDKDAKEEVMKAFIYAMGMDKFVKMEDEDTHKVYWYFNLGAKQIKVTQRGYAIGNSFVALYDSLYYNGNLVRRIIKEAKSQMRSEKGYMDAEEMQEAILKTYMIQDLAQSIPETDDDNIFDIFLMMYKQMEHEREWPKLFKALSLMLFEYLEFMFDDNRRMINEAYEKAIDMFYQNCSVAAKERAGEKLDIADTRLKVQIREMKNERYL